MNRLEQARIRLSNYPRKKLMQGPSFRQRFVDIYGDTWIGIYNGYVKREEDGNIGGYFNGIGLREIN